MSIVESLIRLVDPVQAREREEERRKAREEPKRNHDGDPPQFACRICGHVGCCDESKHRHATKSFHATGHPIIQSFERGEDWMWCHVDEVFLDPAPMSRDTTPDG